MASPRYFRIVSRPESIPNVEALLRAEGFDFMPEPSSIYCRKLTHEPFALGASLAAIFGNIYIQDRSSMLPPIALDPPPGSMALDISASPGSKTGFLAQLTGPDGFVLANEPNRARLGTLRANLQRLNLFQAATTCHDGALLPLFDHSWSYILLDPPCSGWGTLDKHPKAGEIWQGEKLKRLVALQRRLLKKAAQLLARGGRLLYSTCTTNQAENEGQTAYAVAELGLEPLPLPVFPGVVCDESPEHGITIDGAASAAQGFYLSLLTRKDGIPATGPRFEPVASFPKEELASPVCDPSLLPPGETALFNQTVRFLPSLANALPAALTWQAFPLGKWENARFKPHATLRNLLPHAGGCSERVIFEDTAPVRQLLSGASVQTAVRDGSVGMWWRELPLGICQVKHGRLIGAF